MSRKMTKYSTQLKTKLVLEILKEKRRQTYDLCHKETERVKL